MHKKSVLRTLVSVSRRWAVIASCQQMPRSQPYTHCYKVGIAASCLCQASCACHARIAVLTKITAGSIQQSTVQTPGLHDARTDLQAG